MPSDIAKEIEHNFPYEKQMEQLREALRNLPLSRVRTEPVQEVVREVVTEDKVVPDPVVSVDLSEPATPIAPEVKRSNWLNFFRRT